jgi:hypothetical protein
LTGKHGNQEYIIYFKKNEWIFINLSSL